MHDVRACCGVFRNICDLHVCGGCVACLLMLQCSFVFDSFCMPPVVFFASHLCILFQYIAWFCNTLLWKTATVWFVCGFAIAMVLIDAFQLSILVAVLQLQCF